MIHVAGAPDPIEWLVGREVIFDDTEKSTVAELAAHLLYWSTLYDFKTQTRSFLKSTPRPPQATQSGRELPQHESYPQSHEQSAWAFRNVCYQWADCELYKTVSYTNS